MNTGIKKLEAGICWMKTGLGVKCHSERGVRFSDGRSQQLHNDLNHKGMKQQAAAEYSS